MTIASGTRPDDQQLLLGLNTALDPGISRPGGVTILERRENKYESTFPSEIVRFCGGDGFARSLLCKYDGGRREAEEGQHRGDLDYEAEVYRRVLHPVSAAVPRLYGEYRDARQGHTWLFLEYLERSARAQHVSGPPSPLVLAAGWIGQFHRNTARLLEQAPLGFLISYDAARYEGYVGRTTELARRYATSCPWLSGLCERFTKEFLPGLLARERSVIHGEFYPDNILYQDGAIYVVDWQSAAKAPGEIDLAVLTAGGWSEELIRDCELEYCKFRWPEGRPADFDHTLAAARLYWPMFFLGDNRTLMAFENYRGYLDELQVTAERLNLI